MKIFQYRLQFSSKSKPLGVDNISRNLIYFFAFRENWHSENHALLKCLKIFLSVLPICSIRFGVFWHNAVEQ